MMRAITSLCAGSATIEAASAGPGSEPIRRGRVSSEIQRILVAIRAGEKGLPLPAQRARLIGQKAGAEIRLVSCVYDSQVAFALARGKRAAGAAQLGILSNEEENLERIAQSLRDWGAQVSTHVLWQAVTHEGLLRYIGEWQPDLVVAGGHRPGLALHTRRIETDWQLMRHCPTPLLIAKDATFAAYDRVLAAVDPVAMHDEPAGLDEHVLEIAALFSRAAEGQLIAAHAYPHPDKFDLASAVEVSPGTYYGTESIELVHRQAVVELLESCGLDDAQIECHPGEPVEVLGELMSSRAVNLVVLGALKRSELEQLLLGSTAESVAYEANCDVVLVKIPA